jgi:methylthioribose-1-phosphate isomerase
VKNWSKYRRSFENACKTLAKSRPTAVNLFHSINAMENCVKQFNDLTPLSEIISQFEKLSLEIFNSDLEKCKLIGYHGSTLAPKDKKINILTHCNTGSLATAGYGTALGVIRSLKAKNYLGHVYVDETRPWLQGARLTAFELGKESINYTLTVDSAAGHLMKCGLVDWVIVGADRIARNGDTANKIGTYSLAVLAKYHGVKFYVAAPWTSFDHSIRHGDEIIIEERSDEEVTCIAGTRIAPQGSTSLNPAFDVTPGELIDGIITETGVILPNYKTSISHGSLPNYPELNRNSL